MKKVIVVMLLVSMSSPVLCSGSLLYEDSQRQSFSESSAPDSLYIVETIELPEPILYPCAAEGGDVYLCGTSSLFCVDFAGTVLWREKHGLQVHETLTPPSIVYGKVAVGFITGMHFFDKNTGESLEYESLFTPIISSPAAVEGYIAFGTGGGRYWRSEMPPDNELVILDKTLKMHVAFKAEGRVNSSPASYLNLIVFTTGEGYIYCIDTEGREMWRHHCEGGVLTTPTIWWGRAFIPSDRKLLCLDLFTGEVLWEMDIEGIQNAYYPNSHLSAGWGHGYLNTEDGVLCVDLLKGSLLWKIGCDNPSEVLVADEKIFFVSGNEFFAYDAFSHELLWTFEAEHELFPPAIYDGYIILSSQSNKLYLLGINPDDYLKKAEIYMEKREFEKAYLLYRKAEEYTGISQKDSIQIAEKGMRDKERTDDAFQKITEADLCIVRGDLQSALSLYIDACETFGSEGTELQKDLCDERIHYLEGRIEEDSLHRVRVLFLVISLLVLALAVALLLIRRYGRGRA